MKTSPTRFDSAKQYIEDCCIPVTETGCWIWTQLDSQERTVFNGLSIFAADLAYSAFKGPIPEDKEIVHKCGVMCCVNPDHLGLEIRHTAH